jgi:hypothetical protein
MKAKAAAFLKDLNDPQLLFQMLIAAQVGVSIIMSELVMAETDAEGRIFGIRRQTDCSVGLLNADGCSMAMEYWGEPAQHEREGGGAMQAAKSLITDTVRPMYRYLRKCNSQYSKDPCIRLASVMDERKGHTFAKEMAELGRTRLLRMMAKAVHRQTEEIEAALVKDSYIGPLLFLQSSSRGKALYMELEILARSDGPMAKQGEGGSWQCILPDCQVLLGLWLGRVVLGVLSRTASGGSSNTAPAHLLAHPPPLPQPPLKRSSSSSSSSSGCCSKPLAISLPAALST